MIKVKPMNPVKQQHKPMLLTPYYARNNRDEQQPQIHEYRNTEYIEKFTEELTSNKLTAAQKQPWYETNKLDNKNYPSLRQPIHQGFYLASCELTCDNKSRAPVDPKRITEAWMLVSPFTENDGLNKLNKKQTEQLLQAFLLRAKEQGGAYPMHATVTLDSKGQKHSMLSGYIPLDDVVNKESHEQTLSEAQINATANEMADSFSDEHFTTQSDQFLWNGENAHPRLKNLLQLLDENLAIGLVQDKLCYTAAVTFSDSNSVKIEEWRNWMRQSYFYETPDTANSINLYAQQQQFKVRKNQLIAKMSLAPLPQVSTAYKNAYNALRQAMLTESMPGLTPRRLVFNTREHYTAERIAGYTSPWVDYLTLVSELLETLRIELLKPINNIADTGGLRLSIDNFNSRLKSTRAAAQVLLRQFQPSHKYRRENLLQWFLNQRENEDLTIEQQLPENQKLIVSANWIRQGPDLIKRRWLMLINAFSSEWNSTGQSTAFSQDDEQLYQIRVIAKVKGDNDCEYLAYSQLGEPFYIASFYETRLMPSYPIKMPTLKDLKKAVSGPAMILPADLATEVSKLKFPDGKVEQEGSGGSGRWIYVFSIPIVTICAMILLMLIINILNFIFRWIPFAILRIPFPK